MAWQRLSDELDRWATAGAVASFWWRDDDAAEATPALERLLALQRATRAPLALAVVPGELSPSLVRRLAHCDQVSVLQHGWRHANHAGKGEGGWELGDHRPLAEVGAELAAGRQRLAEGFGSRFLPVMVPPWNHISGRMIEALPGLGFTGLSTFRARASAAPAPGLVQVNSHCDPIKWRPSARFAGTGKALADLVGHLQARRTGAADPAEPTGLVTHHLALDEPAWEFVALLLRRTSAHPVVVWQDARDAFPA
jgi:hypothetical protein